MSGTKEPNKILTPTEQLQSIGDEMAKIFSRPLIDVLNEIPKVEQTKEEGEQ